MERGVLPKAKGGCSLIAAHLLTVRKVCPSDLAQRLGRIVRQGNKNPEVEIFRYVTEGTFDSYLYQLVENKQKFIAQIMTSKTPVRVAEDVDETALSYAEIKALATGNPLIIEKCQLEMDVNKLKILQASHLSQKYALEDKILKEYPQAIKRLTERITGCKADMETVAKHPADEDHRGGSPCLPADENWRDSLCRESRSGQGGNRSLQSHDLPRPRAAGRISRLFHDTVL